MLPDLNGSADGDDGAYVFEFNYGTVGSVAAYVPNIYIT